LAATLRFYKLGQIPIELFGDELDVGYQAYSIVKTGGDYFGNKWPTFFRSLDEYRMPMLVYLTVPFVSFFGLNAWVVRLAPALFGCLSIVLFWFFLNQLTADKVIAWGGAFLMALVPWHLHYSRCGFDVTILLTIVLVAMICFIKGLKSKFFLILSCLIWPLAFYTYSTSLVFTLFFLPLLVWIFRKEISRLDKKSLLAAGIIFLIVSLPLLINLVNRKALGRFSKISIVKDAKMIDEIHYKRSQSGGQGRIFHNKAVYLGRKFFSYYLQAFSPEFLFIKGDPNPRHSVNDFGMLPFVLVPCLLFGLYAACVEQNIKLKRANCLFLVWLLTASIAAALTVGGGNHATRLFLMLPPWLYFASLGIKYILSSWNKLVFKGLLMLLVVAFIGEWTLYANQYFFHYPRESWEFFDYGYREAGLYLKEHQSQYDQVFIDSAKTPPILSILYWLEIDPSWLKSNYQGQDWQVDVFPGFDGFKLGKYYFGDVQKSAQLDQFLSPEMIYLVFQNSAEIPGDWDWEQSPPAGVKVLKVVRRPFTDIPLIYLLSGAKD